LSCAIVEGVVFVDDDVSLNVARASGAFGAVVAVSNGTAIVPAALLLLLL
jgi:hypothetical protein